MTQEIKMLATKPSNLSSVPGPIWCVREQKPSDIHTCAKAPTYIQNHFLFRKKKKDVPRNHNQDCCVIGF